MDREIELKKEGLLGGPKAAVHRTSGAETLAPGILASRDESNFFTVVHLATVHHSADSPRVLWRRSLPTRRPKLVPPLLDCVFTCVMGPSRTRARFTRVTTRRVPRRPLGPMAPEAGTLWWARLVVLVTAWKPAVIWRRPMPNRIG